MPERRFFVPPEDLRDAPDRSAEPRVAAIRGDEHHHLSRVLRLKPGDAVSVFDGQGRGYLGVIDAIGKGESRVILTAPDDRAVEPAFRLTLAQGIPHHDKMDLIVQKATELGVAAIVPIIAQRSAIKAGGSEGRLRRWRRVAREAARQSGRLRVPEVIEPVSLAGLAGAPDDAGARRLILCPAPIDPAPPGALAMAAQGRAAVVAVGPEGGWTAEEIDAAMERGFAPLNLGPRVLRAETAGIVAVALVLFAAGEMGAPSPARGGP